MYVHNVKDIARVLLIFLITVLFAALGYSKVPEGLVLYLSFDEGSGKVIKDLSGNGNDGENNGAKWVEGKYGKALEYGGVDSWVTVPDTPTLNFGPKESLTAQCWGKVTGPPSGQGNFLAKYAVGAGTTPFYGMFHDVGEYQKTMTAFVAFDFPHSLLITHYED